MIVSGRTLMPLNVAGAFWATAVAPAAARIVTVAVVAKRSAYLI
jgi:hypothetical protein